MNTRILARVWIACILLVVVAVGSTVALGWNRESIVFSMGEAKVAVVGSSLLRTAVPFKPVDGGLLGDGRLHQRIAVNGLTEAEAISVLDRLVAQKADLVLLEANPFVIDLTRRGNVQRWWRPKRWWSSIVGVPFRRGVDRMQGRGFTFNLASESLLGGMFKPKRSTLGRYFPVGVHSPEYPERLGEAVGKAKQAGVRVILVVPPRPGAVAEIMGAENLAEVQTAYENLAATYGLELWVFDTDWPSELFSDRGHFNRAGRERFVTELREKYRRAP